MLVLFWVLLFVVATCLILLMPALWGKHVFDSFRGNRSVNCPETRSPVVVRFDALRAAFTSLSGKPSLRLSDCSRWPVRADCGQDCIPDAIQSAPVSAVRELAPRQHRIAHLPALVATGAVWVLGAIWHSQYVLRPQWTNAMNISNHETLALAEMWIPHLLTAAACLLFAYAVASTMAWTGKRTLAHGIQIALSLWLVVALVLLVAGGLQANHQLLWIEGGYTFAGSILVGALVGGLPRRVLVKDDV
jgi:hypothetical protein